MPQPAVSENMRMERRVTGVPATVAAVVGATVAATVAATVGAAVAPGGVVSVDEAAAGVKVGLTSTVGATRGEVGSAFVGPAPAVLVGGTVGIGVDNWLLTNSHANVVLRRVSHTIEGRMSLRISHLLSV